MPRGGYRRGKGGTSYGNRTDLNVNKVASGQRYGQAADQRAALKAVPINVPSTTGPAMAMPSQEPIQPGGLGPLHAPTDRPGEPLTHGLPTGPGGGPEVLTPPNPLVKAAAVLNNLGSAADADTIRLRDFVNATLGNQGAA